MAKVKRRRRNPEVEAYLKPALVGGAIGAAIVGGLGLVTYLRSTPVERNLISLPRLLGEAGAIGLGAGAAAGVAAKVVS